MLSKSCHHLSPSSIRDMLFIPKPKSISLIMVLEKAGGNQALCKESTGINHNIGLKKIRLGTPQKLYYWNTVLG